MMFTYAAQMGIIKRVAQESMGGPRMGGFGYGMVPSLLAICGRRSLFLSSVTNAMSITHTH